MLHLLAPKPKPSSAGFTLHQTPQRRDGAIIYQDKQVLLPERLEATFLTSAPDLRRCPPADAPEVAFAGRSNAGKSSVLNQLSGNRRTAKVSKTPGRTQLLNFFDVRQGGRLVDLPGYGLSLIHI